MASIIAPNANIAVNPNMKVYGQVLAKFINLSNGFDASLGEFVPFQPVGITIAGADTLKFYEDPTGSPDYIFTENSRMVEIPVISQTALENNVSVQFKIIKSPLPPAADSGRSLDFTSNSSDKAEVFSSGTLTFLKGQKNPNKLPSFYLYDDGQNKQDEYLRVVLYNASPSDSVKVEGQNSSGFGIFDIPIVSDDPFSIIPDSLVFSSDSFPENQNIGYFLGLLQTFDSNKNQVYTYNFVESSKYISNNKFQIRSDSLFTAQLTLLGDSSLIQRTTNLDSLIGNQV